MQVVQQLLQGRGNSLGATDLEVVRSLLKSGAGQRTEIARFLVGVLDSVSLGPQVPR